MARSLTELHEVLSGLVPPEDGQVPVYIQPGLSTKLTYPCIIVERSSSWTQHADDIKYVSKKRYLITVIDRAPDSTIPDLVEALPHTRFDRFAIRDGLNHFYLELFF